MNERTVTEIVYGAIVSTVGENFSSAECSATAEGDAFDVFLRAELLDGSFKEFMPTPAVREALGLFSSAAKKTHGTALTQATFTFTNDGDSHSSFTYAK